MVSVRLSADRIRVVADGADIASHCSSFGREQLICEPWHYVPVLETKPGALRHGVPFVEWVLPPALTAVRTALLKQSKGDRAFADILLGAREHGLEALEVACQLAQEQGSLSAAIILNELRRLTEPPRSTTLCVPDDLLLREEPSANCARYDSLREASHA